jgi:Biotin-requiring enzyme
MLNSTIARRSVKLLSSSRCCAVVGQRTTIVVAGSTTSSSSLLLSTPSSSWYVSFFLTSEVSTLSILCVHAVGSHNTHILSVFRFFLFRTRHTQKSRYFSPSAVVCGDDLPYHIVVGMPALSPTMETGILAEWYLEEGAGFSAGDALAKIETDKASIDFEAQDDGFIAKILMEAGTGADITVGTPIMVTVEEEEEVAAFANFVLEETAAAAPAPAAAEPEPAVVAAVETTPPPPPPAAAETTPPLPPPPSAPLPDMGTMVAAVAPVLSTGWGDFAKINSPLIKTLSKQQNEYIKKYGTTGQIPL